jgi:hypothetical protein
LFNDDGSRFECKISAVMAGQGNIIGSVDTIGSDRRVMGDLFGD